jgi:hypothetical protein
LRRCVSIDTIAFFFAIPIGVWIIQETVVDWTVIAAFVLIGIGLITIINVFFFWEEPETL